MGKLNDQFLRKREADIQNRAEQQKIPQITSSMAKAVSAERRAGLEVEVERGLFRDGSGGINNSGLTPLSAVTSSSSGIKKNAQVLSTDAPGGGPGGYRGPGGSVRQIPELYSPLWLTSNLNLPRDRATINAWCRSFYALQPFVQNAINLHSTYPISKLNIKCPNKKVEKFFNDMIEEIDLMNVCVQVAQEYWLLGEAFVYAELDERTAKWSRLVIQNPDYVVVKKSVIASEPLIMLRPDENLRRLVLSNKPADIEQKSMLNPTIIEHIRRGENIPQDNFYISHLARKISPYEVRGTGLPVCCFRQLMLFDKIRECFDEKTEVFTDQGFKKITDLIQETTGIDQNPNYINGISLENGQISSILTMKEDFKVACVNPETNEIEFHKPIELHMSQYSGEMLHFNGKKVDVMVSPNHKMLAKEQTNGKWGEYKKIPAAQLLDKKKYWKFKTQAKYVSGNDVRSIKIGDKEVPIELYLKVLGYIISEGCVYENYKKGRYDALVITSQATSSDCYTDMRTSFNEFAGLLDKTCHNKRSVIGAGFSEHKPQEMWSCKIHGKDLTQHLKNEIGTGGNCLSKEKRIPRWVLDLKPELLEIILYSLVKGDGSETISKYGSGAIGYRYSTISKQLADDVYEIAYKLGFTPNICVSRANEKKRAEVEYIVLWSDTNYGVEPLVYSDKRPVGQIGGGAFCDKVNYNGVVWCFEVPTGLFVTRRNGKIAIHGNSKFAQADNMINPITLIKVGSADFKPTPQDLEAWRETMEMAQYDKDFKIITHEAVTIEYPGHNQGIYDTSGDITQLLKEVFMGLMIPEVLMSGSGDVTYANGGISLDVLRQRYMQFRNMLSAWLRKKIFAPISKLNEFYEYEDGEKKLILPEIDWNHMSLFDTADFVNVLVQLSGEQKKVSQQTLYRSLGLEYDEERRKIKKEDIGDAIRAKELASLAVMPLNELRALGDEDEIQEVTQTPLPGQDPSSALPGQQQMPAGGPGGLPPLPIGAPPLPGGAGDMGLGMPPPSPGGVPGQSMPPPGPPPPPK